MSAACFFLGPSCRHHKNGRHSRRPPLSLQEFEDEKDRHCDLYHIHFERDFHGNNPLNLLARREPELRSWQVPTGLCGWPSPQLYDQSARLSLGGSGSLSSRLRLTLPVSSAITKPLSRHTLQVVSAADVACFVGNHGAPVVTRAKLGVVRFVDRTAPILESAGLYLVHFVIARHTTPAFAVACRTLAG